LLQGELTYIESLQSTRLCTRGAGSALVMVVWLRKEAVGTVIRGLRDAWWLPRLWVRRLLSI